MYNMIYGQICPKAVMSSVWYFEGNPLNHTSDMLATGVLDGEGFRMFREENTR